MTTIAKNCEVCKEEFRAELREIKRGNGKFCSLRCSARNPRRHNQKENNCICANPECEKSFYRSNSKMKLSKSGLLFCSRECKELLQKIGGHPSIQPSHYNTGHSRYRERALEKLEQKCFDCDYDRFKQVLEVHHLDGDRTNGEIKNLVMVCPRCHVERHEGLRPNVNYDNELIALPPRRKLSIKSMT